MDLREFTQDELREFLTERGLTRYASSQIFNWVYKRGIEDFWLMTNLAKDLRKTLSDEFYFSSLKLKAKSISKDKTAKFLFEFKDGDLVEAVLIPEAKRNTACLSTQAGCKFKCGFCASGSSGFKRDLSCAEMVNQFLALGDFLKPKVLSNVVFMGVGEPLDNFDNLIKAINILRDEKGIYLAKRKVCVSTCGLVPEIKRLADLKLGVKLSVSLHSADDEIRSKIMPINKKYPLGELIKALRYFVNISGFSITFEYLLIKGLNSSAQDALKFASLARKVDCKTNLIVYNPSPCFDWQPADKEEIAGFSNILKAKGVFFTLRKSRGQDIEAACGQLKGSFLSQK